MLNYKQILALKPKEKSYSEPVAQNIRIEVKPDGRKYFKGSKRIEGVSRHFSLGRFNPEKGPKFFGIIEAGIRFKEKVAELEGQEPTPRPIARAKPEPVAHSPYPHRLFSEVFEEWIERAGENWSEKTRKAERGRFENWVLPILGDIPIAEVRRENMIAMMDRIYQREAHAQRQKLPSKLKSLFNFAQDRYVPEGFNPADINWNERGYKPFRSKPFKSLPWEQRHDLWEALENVRELRRSTANAIRLIVLTFGRVSEVLQLRWDQIDNSGPYPIWKIPEDKMKTREHWIPLPPEAVAIIEEQREVNGDIEVAFPGKRSRSRLANKTLTSAAVLGFLSKSPSAPTNPGLGFDATLHGFRHMASTALNEAHQIVTDSEGNESLVRLFHPDWIEVALSHKDQDKTRSAYNHAQYLDERYRMLCWYADQMPRPKGRKGGSPRLKLVRAA